MVGAFFGFLMIDAYYVEGEVTSGGSVLWLLDDRRVLRRGRGHL